MSLAETITLSLEKNLLEHGGQKILRFILSYLSPPGLPHVSEIYLSLNVYLFSHVTTYTASHTLINTSVAY